MRLKEREKRNDLIRGVNKTKAVRVTKMEVCVF